MNPREFEFSEDQMASLCAIMWFWGVPGFILLVLGVKWGFVGVISMATFGLISIAIPIIDFYLNDEAAMERFIKREIRMKDEAEEWKKDWIFHKALMQNRRFQ